MKKTLTIGITGAYGMLGKHIRGYLYGFPQYSVLCAGRNTFSSQSGLSDFSEKCDIIIHLAGLNRGDPKELEQTNIALTNQLVDALIATKSRAHVLFSSSTHVTKDTAYGESKRQSAQLLRAWEAQNDNGGRFTNVILPGVFGEGGKPYYNSVVSTFCHQITHNLLPTIDTDTDVEQIHAQEVARYFAKLFHTPQSEDVHLKGNILSVSQLLRILDEMNQSYQQHIIPHLQNDFYRDLFNTYRSYLYPQHYPRMLTLNQDSRGVLFEVVKSFNGGQIFMSTTHPNVVRGNHYHTRKVERFSVIHGEAEIKIRSLFDNVVQTFRVSGLEPSYVDIPTLHTHSITNTGSDTLSTLFWTNELFDPKNSDQYPEKVEL